MGAIALITALGLTSLALSVLAFRARPQISWKFETPKDCDFARSPQMETIFEYRPAMGIAHAPAIEETDDGARLFWFQGKREARPDIAIMSVKLLRDGKAWRTSEPITAITSPDLSDRFHPNQLVVTMGNMIANPKIAGGLYLTVVSLGGWAMASLAQVSRLKPVRKINLSPILNRSILVKSPMVAYADGDFGLPAYFEMGSAYGLLARLDASGRAVDAARICAKGAKVIQPMIVPTSANDATAFLRIFESKDVVWTSHTTNGGQSWSRAKPTQTANPSAPIAALRLDENRILVAMNDDPGAPEDLQLSITSDRGATYQALFRFVADKGAVRYPMLHRLSCGNILLCYSFDGKRGIRAHLFNGAWVDSKCV